ncbi:MAG TPA: hypothetical protein VM925_28820 [Labilithrix sp.]|nr:hypothetical protein [Labilithrix sp.]
MFARNVCQESSGSGARTGEVVVPPAARLYGVTADETHLYWAQGLEDIEGTPFRRGGTIHRVPVGGGRPELLRTVISHAGDHMPMLVQGGRLYTFGLLGVESMPSTGVAQFEHVSASALGTSAVLTTGADLRSELTVPPSTVGRRGLRPGRTEGGLLIAEGGVLRLGQARHYTVLARPPEPVVDDAGNVLESSFLDAAVLSDGAVIASLGVLENGTKRAEAALLRFDSATPAGRVLSMNAGHRHGEQAAPWELFDTSVGLFAQCRLGAQAWRTPESIRPRLYRVETGLTPILRQPVMALDADRGGFVYALERENESRVYFTSWAEGGCRDVGSCRGAVKRLFLRGGHVLAVVEMGGARAIVRF